LTSIGDKRAVFEQFVKGKFTDEKRERKKDLKHRQEAFRELLAEHKDKIDHKTVYAEFKITIRDDPRYEELERREREIIFGEVITPLREAFNKSTPIRTFPKTRQKMFQKNALSWSFFGFTFYV
jgi:hypothetical protein